MLASRPPYSPLLHLHLRTGCRALPGGRVWNWEFPWLCNAGSCDFGAAGGLSYGMFWSAFRTSPLTRQKSDRVQKLKGYATAKCPIVPLRHDDLVFGSKWSRSFREAQDERVDRGGSVGGAGFWFGVEHSKILGFRELRAFDSRLLFLCEM